MKKFIKKIIITLLPIIVIAYPIDNVMSYYLRQSKAYSGEMEVWGDIYNGNANCDLAIYGSSKAYVQFDPKIIEKYLHQHIYNFGINGHKFDIQYLRHLEFIKHNKLPKTIILSVDIFTLGKRNDLYNPDQFLPFMLWNRNMYKYTSSFGWFTNTDYYLPLTRYVGKRNALIEIWKNFIQKSPEHNFRTKGYKGMNLQWNHDLENAQTNKTNYEAHIDKETIRLFNHFVKSCIELNINLILVYTPEHIDGQKYVSNRKDIINFYKETAIKNHLHFLDYSNDALCFDKKYFYNSSHLNITGAEIFSKKLAAQLNALFKENKLAPNIK